MNSAENIIHLSSEGDSPHASVKRQIGKLNAGLYCTNCSEFFAVAVIGLEDKKKIENIEFKANGPVLFGCPFCHQGQRREVSEIGLVILTEGNKRKPPPRRDHH